MRTIFQQIQAEISNNLLTIGVEKPEADKAAQRFLTGKLEHSPVACRRLPNEIVFHGPNGTISIDRATGETVVCKGALRLDSLLLS